MSTHSKAKELPNVQDLDETNVGQLNEILIALKTKHYFGGGLNLAERKGYWMTKAVYKQKMQNLHVTPINQSHHGISIN
jgi:hypothetical protein